ncbi:MAG: hypoxanthine phosphoribosyltransferase [Smithellaceae bacterium]
METSTREILFTRSVIDERVREMADQISRDYEGGELVMVGVLKGAFVFMADLMRAVRVPCRTDFIRASSYGAEMESSGRIVITKDIELPVEGCDVLVVDDIVDTGLTLCHIVDSLRQRNPRSIRVCAFLDKRLRRKTPFEADYVGFAIDDGFVVGYGLDFGEQYRSLPDVYVIQAGIMKETGDKP